MVDILLRLCLLSSPMSKATEGTGSFEKNLALYDAVVAAHPQAERLGHKIPSTSLNGHMYSYLGRKGELAMKLPPGEREAFLEKYDTTLCKLYGIVQKEFVIVPDSLLARTQELKKYFAMSYAYAKTIRPTKAAAASVKKKNG
jgi:hypothetical protein